LYDLPSPKEVASGYDSTPANSLGVFEGFGTYNQSDLNIFFERWAPEVYVLYDGTAATTQCQS
jgi:hypothetical protein